MEFGPERAAAARTAFAAARPFPHLVIDDFLTTEGKAGAADFPAGDWPGWRLFLDDYQKEKRTCNDIETMPRSMAALIDECSTPRFLAFLEAVTGIGGLLTDPYLDGGGLHCSGPGGVLAPHTDFHLYKRLNLYRAINLLIYLNPDWSEADGGGLELYGPGDTAPAVSVTPVLGRAVIFRTDDRSIHGFTEPVAPDRWRRSIALYYYTSRETGRFSGDTGTHWRNHGARLTGPRLAVFEALIFCSRAFSKAAHAINPNKGA